MTRFVLHPDTFNDLEEIWEFIAVDSLNAADQVIGEIHDSITSLVSFPLSGHLRPDLTSKPLRFHRVRDFLIARMLRMKCPCWLSVKFTAAGILVSLQHFSATENKVSKKQKAPELRSLLSL